MDQATKEAVEKPSTIRSSDSFASLTDVRRTITERKWREARHWLRIRLDDQGTMQRARYNLVLEVQGPNEEAMDTMTQVSLRYFQLKSGHAVTGAYLHRIGKTDSDRC